MNQEIETKKCSNPNCLQPIKPISDFYFSMDNNTYRNKCKKCVKMIVKQYRLKNPEKIKQRKRIAHLKNRISDNQKSKQWYINNPEKVKKQNSKFNLKHPHYQTQRRKERCKTEPNFKLITILRTQMWNILKYKHYKTSILLGCSGIKHQKLLEAQFYKNMTWKLQGKGYGHWQVHHICPLEYFDMTDPIEQRQAWHYSNTKPLWYEDHIEEHRKINERMTQYENNGKPIKLSIPI